MDNIQFTSHGYVVALRFHGRLCEQRYNFLIGDPISYIVHMNRNYILLVHNYPNVKSTLIFNAQVVTYN